MVLSACVNDHYELFLEIRLLNNPKRGVLNILAPGN